MANSNVAIVTGGAQGIGASITKALLAKGYAVVVADIQEEKAKQFVSEQEKIHGAGKVSFVLCDVTKLEDYKRTFEFTLKQFNGVDVLVNNAGIFLEQNALKTLSVNVMGPINGCQTAFDFMGKSKGGRGGFIINVASLAGFVSHPAFPIYSASKHAVIALTRSYGHEYYQKKEGIIVSALCPSYVDTEILKGLPQKTITTAVCFGKEIQLLKPDDVAQGVIKLLEDKISGSTLVVTKEEGFFYVGLQEEIKNIDLF